MKLLKKTYLSTTLAVALAGGVVPGYVGAVTLSQDNIGDSAVVPYYTMRDGWATDFYIINTSNKTTAAKVRFHEARNSREVLDFIVVLSPYDQINAFAVLDPNLGPVVRFPAGNSEKTCVVPIPNGRVGGVGGYLPFSAFEYTGGNYDNWPSSERDEEYGPLGPIDRALEGYFTVIEMGTSDDGPVHAAALHPNPNCEAVAEAFRIENIVPTYEEFDRNLNNLKVGFSLTNPARGVQGSGSATMMANFATNRSSIAHTMTSIMAGGADVVAAQAALDAAEDVRQDTYDATVAAAAALRLIVGCNQPNPPGEFHDSPAGNTLPGTCQGNPALLAQYDSAVLAYNNARVALAAANQNLQDALAAQLSAPRNLIHAQDGSPTVGDPERAPNLNHGDFFAYWFRDGQYRTLDNYDQLPDAINLPFGLWIGLYPRPVDAVTALLMKSDALNEWAYNANTGASSDLVLTAPTKRFYTDWVSVYENEPHLVGISPILANAVANTDAGWPPFGNQFIETGRSCDKVAVAFYNNDEVGPKDPILPSPSPDVRLCWETNIVYTGQDSVLGSEVAQRLDVRNLLAVAGGENETYNGWVNVNMTVNAHNYHPAIPLLNITLPNVPPLWPFDEIVQTGMPYIGFAFKERDLGNPANAYGGLTPHSYLRNWDKRNALGGTITVEDLGAFGPVIIPSVLSFFETNPVLPIDNR